MTARDSNPGVCHPVRSYRLAHRLRYALQDVVGSTLRSVRGRSQDPRIVLQPVGPGLQVGSGVFHQVPVEPDRGVQHRGSDLRDQFLLRVLVAAEGRRVDPVLPLLVTAGVHDLVEQGLEVVLRSHERLSGGHLDRVPRGAVVGPVAAVREVDALSRQPRVGQVLRVVVLVVEGEVRGGVERLPVDALSLRDVKHRRVAEQPVGPGDLARLLVLLLDLLVVDHGVTRRVLDDPAAHVLALLKGHEPGVTPAVDLHRHAQAQTVDPAVGLAGRTVLSGVHDPGLGPRSDALPHHVDQRRGDLCVDFLAVDSHASLLR